MYLGKLVELAPTEDFRRPPHACTQAPPSAVPLFDPARQRQWERIVLQEGVPAPAKPPGGCRLYTRCPFAAAICREEEPEPRVLDNGHRVVCQLAEELPLAPPWEATARGR